MEKALRTKVKILRSALALFVENGIDKTSTNLIAKTAGVASGTIFTHFPTKQSLVDQLYLDIQKPLFETMAAAINNGKNFEYNIKNITITAVDYFQGKSLAYQFYNSINTEIDISSNLISQSQQDLIKIVRYVKKGVEQNQLKPLPIEILYDVFWNTTMSLVSYSYKNQIDTTSDKFLDLVWDQLSS